MTDILESKPTEPGVYLVVRNRYGEKWFEILRFDGRYWITGLHDDPASKIEAWTLLPPPEYWKHVNIAVKKMNESLDEAIGDFKEDT